MVFLCCFNRHTWLQLLQAVPIKGVGTNELLSWCRIELESSLNPQTQWSCSLGTVMTGQGHGSEWGKQLNKEAAREGFLWIWPRTAVTTWQPVGCMHHKAVKASLALLLTSLATRQQGQPPFLCSFQWLRTA